MTYKFETAMQVYDSLLGTGLSNSQRENVMRLLCKRTKISYSELVNKWQDWAEVGV